MDALVQAARVLDVALAEGGLRGLKNDVNDAPVGHMLWPAAGVMLTVGKECVILSRAAAIALADDLRSMACDA